MDNMNVGAMTTSPSLTPQMMQANQGYMTAQSAGQVVEGGKVQSYGSPSNLSMMDLCKQHMNQFVQLQTTDHMLYSGIITGVDNEHVHLAVPNWGNDPGGGWMMRQPFHGGFHGSPFVRPPFFGGYYPYGFYRPFNRFLLPLSTLVALSLLPWY